MTGQFPGGEPGMPNGIALLTVLIVEDDALIRMHGIDILEAAGFCTLEAENADEALDMLGHGPAVHILFSDVDMPGQLDGLGLARIVHDRWPHIHLLLTSGHHRLQDADVPGAGRFVRKPWTTESIVDEMRLLIDA